MKLETFFEKFAQFADAPGAVEKMRELVLRLATSGRIAKQHPADQPGSELLKEIFAVRDRLIKRGAAKSRVEGNPITAGDTIDLPPSWDRCMISEVCDLQTGATPSRAEHSYFGGDTPWLVSGDINKGDINECDGRITKEGLENSNCKIIPAGSVLIALNGQGKTRATVAVLRIPAALNQSLVAMIPYSGERLLPEYIFWNLRGRYYAIRDITGQDQRRGLNMKLVGQLSLPIPPLAEQKRIVVKVDELMALCDRLEAQQQERETRHTALVRASLARFADAPTPANLQFLFHPSYAIPPADLRKTILTLAVQGKLVPQDPNEDPAEADFKSLVRARENSPLKRTKIDEEATAEDPLIPDLWMSVSLGELVSIRTGFAFKSGDYAEHGTLILRVTNINPDGSFDTSNAVFLPEAKLDDKMRGFLLDEHELLVVMVGGSLGKIGQVTAEILPALLNQNMWRLKPYSDQLDHRFLRLVLHDLNENRLQITPSTHGHLAMGTYAAAKVPFPPLAEQRRIVAKVEQLIALVHALETQLAASRATAANLLSALVAELTTQKRSRK